MKAQSVALVLSLVASSGCVDAYAPQLKSGAREVAVYESADTLPATCQQIGEDTARDGNTGSRTGRVYVGSYENALARLRNRAAANGANGLLVLNRYISSFCFHCGGHEVSIDGAFLSCPDLGDVRAN